MPSLQRIGDGRFQVKRPIVCPHCDGATFEERRGVLDTRAATFFNVSWANRGSLELICRGCGFMQTFAEPR